MLAQRRPSWSEELKQVGIDQGLTQGLAQGRSEGRIQGESTILHRQLVRRFGDLPEWVIARLAAPAEDELLRWAERVLDAESLEALFGE
jgi:hypothetical protein